MSESVTVPLRRYGSRFVKTIPGRYPHWVCATLVGTYLLMLLGAYTSAIGAGLSCPDWPTCYGTWVPFLHPQVMSETPYSSLQIAAEWTHRTLASLVGLGIVGTAVGAWTDDNYGPVVKWSATVAVILLPVQVFLGRLTVTAALEPLIVTAHLGLASLILISLTVSAVLVWRR